MKREKEEGHMAKDIDSIFLILLLRLKRSLRNVKKIMRLIRNCTQSMR